MIDYESYSITNMDFTHVNKNNLKILLLSCVLKVATTFKQNDFYESYLSMPQLFEFDDYGKCMLLEDTQYCRITLKLLPSNYNNQSVIWKTIKLYSSNSKNYRHDLLRHGVCLYEKFKHEDISGIETNQLRLKLTNLFNHKYQSSGLVVDILELQCEANNKPLYVKNFFYYTFLFSLAGYMVFVIFATVFDNRYNFTSTFSLTRNYQRLISVNFSDSNVHSLACIQGIRFFNFMLVLSAHSVTTELATPIANPWYVEKMVFYIQDEFSVVNTNFFITNFLFMNSFLTNLKHTNVKLEDIFRFWFFRYLRLLPSLLVVLGFISTILPHLSRGLFWQQLIGSEHYQCRQFWWTNVLFLNDFSKFGCMPHGWYLAADMQMFIIILFLLYFIQNWKERIPYLIVASLGLQTVVSFSAFYYYNWELTFAQVMKPENFYNFKYRLSPQFRFSASALRNLCGPLTGLLFGYYYNKYPKKTVCTQSKLKNISWFLLTVMPTLFLNYFANVISFSHDFSRIYKALFSSTKIVVFLLFVGSCIFGMTQGFGGPIKRMFESRFFYILGRLTYCTYLIHFLVILIRVGNRQEMIYFNNYAMFYQILGNLFMSYFLGFVLSLFIEMPCLELLSKFKDSRQYRKGKNE